MQVILYTKPSCQPCRLTKRKLDQLDIEYEAVDLLPEDAERFREEGLGSAPVVDVDLGGGAHWRWAGFSPTQLEYLDHAFGCSDPECPKCEAIVAA